MSATAISTSPNRRCYRLTQGAKSVYAMNDADKDRLHEAKDFKAGSKVEVSRFKGLGEMPPAWR